MSLLHEVRHRPAVRCLAAAAVSWLPLFALALLSGRATGDPATRPLLVDLSVDARFLLALPLFIAANAYVGPRLQSVLDYLSASDMLVGTERDRFETAAGAANGWCDARLTKVCLAVLAMVGSWLTLVALVEGGNASWFCDGTGRYAGVSAAGWWHVTVALTLWHYVALQAFWRFVVWSVFLARLARLDLQLVPTHPDRCGGLGILEMGQVSFSVLSAGAAVILAASLAESLIAGSLSLAAAVPNIILFVLTSVVIILVPLLGFVPVLARAKRSGLVTYGDLGEGLFRAFAKKWTGLDNEKQAEMLGGTDPSSLADYGYAYEVVASMRTVAFSRNGLLAVAVAALIPFLPLVFIAYSTTEVLQRLLGLGG